MNNINQTSKIAYTELDRLLKKYGDSAILLDSSEILDDLALVEKKSLEVKKKGIGTVYRNNKVSLDNIWGYLKKLSLYALGKEIRLEFDTDGKRIDCYPITTIKIDEPKLKLKFEFSDYISLVEPLDKIVRINYSDVMDCIALDVCRPGLFISHDDIEDKLGNLGPILINNIEALNYFKFRNLHNMAQELKVERSKESDYYDVINRKDIDYFGNHCKKDDYYYTMINSSLNYCMCVIVYNLLSDVYNSNEKLKIISVYKDEIVLSVEDKGSIMEILSEPLVVRVFGRKFKVEPKITEITIQKEKR